MYIHVHAVHAYLYVPAWTGGVAGGRVLGGGGQGGGGDIWEEQHTLLFAASIHFCLALQVTRIGLQLYCTRSIFATGSNSSAYTQNMLTVGSLRYLERRVRENTARLSAFVDMLWII